MRSPPSGWLRRPPSLPSPLRHWLCDRGSLTRRLKSHCQHFSVSLQCAALGRAPLDETALLGVGSSQHAYLREVLLQCNGTPVVFAHSVLPRASLRGPWNGISRLGTRPLGEALFSNPRIHRNALTIRKLSARHPLFRRIARLDTPGSVPAHKTGETASLVLPPHITHLWARRSVFCLAGRPLLVTEVFLPAIVAP